MLTNKDIYDIAALCSEDERLLAILRVSSFIPLRTETDLLNFFSGCFLRLVDLVVTFWTLRP